MNKKLHILIVDDDPSMARTLKDILNLKGFAADAVNSGMDAVQRVRQDRFDFVLTDIKMPGMNGVELIRAIKKIRSDIAFLMMTAYSSNTLVDEGKKEGVVGIFTKPIDMNELFGFFK